MSSRDKQPGVPNPAHRLARCVALLASVVVLAVTLVQLALAWSGLEQNTTAKARRLAESISVLETTAFAAQAQRLLDAAGASDGDGERRALVDAAGTVLAQSGVAGDWSFLRTAPVGAGADSPVVQVHRALAPLLWSGVLGLLGACAAGVAGLVLVRRLVPSILADGGPGGSFRAPVRNEFHVLFERSDDGLLICATGGRVIAGNPAALRLFGVDAQRLAGSNIAEWIVPDAEPQDRPFPVRTGEVAARRQGQAAPFAARVEVHETHQDGESRFIVGVRDLTGQRETQRKLEYLANYDSLTGLPNRVLFRDRLAQAMERARRTGTPMALMFLDLDRFKVVNDSLGHEVGDRLLCHVAETLTRCLRGVDSVARSGADEPFTLSRLGGDEFTVIVESVAGAEDAALIARRLLDALAAPFPVGDEELHVSASIGISMYPVDDVDLDGMIRHTDMAMYRSKSLGRNTYSFFSDDLNAAVSARLSLEGNLRRALERKEFVLHFQPKADLVTGRVTGVEALLRWHAPGRGMISPDRFIAVLEDTGLIVPVGAWVIRAALKQLAEWDRLGLPPINVAVNLSARQLRHPYLVALVGDTLRETGVDAGRLELELTESLLMEDTEVNRGVLAGFARLGVKLAIDDFGTGHSSLSYLRRLDVDTLKIDRSFVMQIPDDPEDCAIATAVIALGQSLQMKVVAEGVETEAQAEFLRNLGCNEMQGWLLGRALPAAPMADWLRARHEDYLARTGPKRFGADEGDPLPTIRIPAATTH